MYLGRMYQMYKIYKNNKQKKSKPLMEEILRHLDQKTNSILDSQKAKIKIKEGIMKEIEKI